MTTNKINENDIEELLDKGISRREIENLSQKGFTKNEIVDAKKYNDEIEKGSTFIAWIMDLITWFLP